MSKKPRRSEDEDDSYEFSSAENDIIAATGQRAKVWGLVSVAAGLLLIVAGVGLLLTTTNGSNRLPNVALILLGLAPFGAGRAYLQAGASLQSIVGTTGRDMQKMMAALTKLTTALRIEAIAAGVVLLGALAMAFLSQSAAH